MATTAAFSFLFRRRAGTPRLFGSALMAGMILSALLGACVPADIVPQARQLDPRDLEGVPPLTAPAQPPWPERRWWRVYNDPQLDGLVEAAVEHNPTIRVAAARVRMAGGMAERAGADLYPRLDAGGRATLRHYSEDAYHAVELSGRDRWDNAALARAVYTLDLWGRERAAYEVGLDELAIAKVEADLIRQELETAVVRTYIALSLHYSLLDVAKETLGQRTGVLEIARGLYDAGIGSELAVRQVETAVPAGRAAIIAIESEITVTKQKLAALTGRGPGAGKGITRPALKLDVVPPIPASLPAELAGRRPDITIRRLRAEAAAGRIKVAKADFYPNINLAGTFGYALIGPGNPFSRSALETGVGPAISLPLFQGGRLRGGLMAATAAYDEAVEEYNSAVIQAFGAVAGSMEELNALERRAAEEAKTLRLARRAYAIANKGYRAGLTDYLGVLTAESTLLRQAQRNAELAADRLDAYARLMHELGGGYMEPPAGARP